MKRLAAFILAIVTLVPAQPAFSDSSHFPLGVCALPELYENRMRPSEYPAYIHEVLKHTGLGYSPVELDKLPEALPMLRILVTTGCSDIPAPMRPALDAWLAAGGVWISVGGVGGLAEWFGVEQENSICQLWFENVLVTLGEGYMEPVAGNSPFTPIVPFPLHFFNGIAVKPTTGTVLARVLDAAQRPTNRPAIVEAAHGKGRCILIAPDLMGTMVRIQQGIPVHCDAVPSPDGAGSTVDHVLKTEDGMTLSWLFDRRTVPGAGELPVFTEPIADCWREVLLRSILQAAQDGQVALPMLWFYPRNLPAIATISHDTDDNQPERAPVMLEELKKMNVHSTWCILLPGYPKEIIQQIAQGGHELAIHFDAMTNPADWNAERFSGQIKALTDIFDGIKPQTNKNHILRWEGSTQFFEWCKANGILMDQTKGPCQSSEVGFLFGTCHPYRPVTPDAKPIDVLELCTHTQDLSTTVPAAIGDMVMAGVLNHYGVAHYLFHPRDIVRPMEASCFEAIVEKGRAQGMEWWMAREITAWERARLAATWTGYTVSTGKRGTQVTATLHAEGALPDATILWLAPEKASAYSGKRKPDGKTVTRWGFPFKAVQSTVDAQSDRAFSVAW